MPRFYAVLDGVIRGEFTTRRAVARDMRRRRLPFLNRHTLLRSQSGRKRLGKHLW